MTDLRDGRKCADGSTGDAAQEERTLPLVVPPPAHWPTTEA